MEFSSTISLEELATRNLNEKNDYCLLAPRKLAVRIDQAILTATEFERMQLFKFEADRERFLVAHGLKRIVLGKIFQCSPHDIPLAPGPGNKPFAQGGKCHFNLSHSGDWIAMILSFTTQVGIDVERPRPTEELPFALVCHPDDRFQLSLETTDQKFYASWTLKEAISKWDGRGLDRPFNEIRLEVAPDNTYLGHHEGMTWHARHTVLHDGAHLAYASEQLLKPCHMLIG
ncbi:4'-phosphopantetheinyl transferase superfamily protein [Phyllobacterium sp. SB3]|uniref:4'-phosphopantetheinyl transferase family protein n=1 Tax=Phyllobacterium sp. SB3 TaxID=3156073 RepID=UPI0032B00F36